MVSLIISKVIIRRGIKIIHQGISLKEIIGTRIANKGIINLREEVITQEVFRDRVIKTDSSIVIFVA